MRAAEARTSRKIILVEGESDRVALETLGIRLGVVMPQVLAVGGSKGARRAADAFANKRLLGLVDIAERHDFERVPPPIAALLASIWG